MNAKKYIEKIDKTEGTQWSEDNELLAKHFNEYAKQHGGKRIGAGRKSRYKEETQTISFRVPKSLIEPITKYVKRALAKSKK